MLLKNIKYSINVFCGYYKKYIQYTLVHWIKNLKHTWYES